MVNSTVLGRLGKDAEAKESKEGKKFVAFSLATDDGYGENRKTVWLECVYASANGEKVLPYLTKGRQVLVQASVTPEVWMDKNKQVKPVLKAFVRSIELVGEKSDDKEGKEDAVFAETEATASE